MHIQAFSRKPAFDWPTMVVIVMASAAFINAAMYISYASIPFVTSDGWYFIDAFLQKHYHGGVTLQDLYIKRSADDHAQPIQKLLLLWNAESFDLDFVIESYMGLAIAAAAWVLMLHAARCDNRDRDRGAWWILPMTASAASFVSLSGGMVFNWSLVTLGYLGPLALIGLAMASWHAVRHGRWLALWLVAAAVAFTLDSAALICAISIALALLILEAKQRGAGWRRTAAVVAVVAVSVVAYGLASRFYLHPHLADAAAGPSALSALRGFGAERLQQMVLSIAALSISDRPALQFYVPAKAELLHRAAGLAVVAAHAWFWWRAWRDAWNRTQFIAVTLMLFCYGAVAGIVIGRVSMFGPDYVFQQRYLMLYQLGTVAVTLMAAGADWSAWRWPQRTLVGLGLLALVAIQWPLSKVTWADAVYVQNYGNNLGREMILLGKDPTVRLASCAPTLVICQADRDEQVRSISLLREHQLNAFSTRMLERYSMESLDADAGPVELVDAPAP